MSFNLAYVVNLDELKNSDSVVDIRSLPIPGTKKTRNFIKGLRGEALLGSDEVHLVYNPSTEMDLKGIDISLTGYSDGDYWNLVIYRSFIQYKEDIIPLDTLTGTQVVWDVSVFSNLQSIDQIVSVELDGQVLDPLKYTVDITAKTITYITEKDYLGTDPDTGEPIIDPETEEPVTPPEVLITFKDTTTNLVPEIICETIYTKEVAESKNFAAFETITPDDKVEFIFYNMSGTTKTIWVDLKFLR